MVGYADVVRVKLYAVHGYVDGEVNSCAGENHN
jgi:hypothetical protein